MPYIIEQVNCTCCHRCRVECPAQAITFRNAKYWIDPKKCVNCGHCVEVCHNECISNPDKPAPAPEPHEKIKKECDVVVIGGGAAGTAAAARAAASGAKVIMLEKGQEVGGSAWYAHMLRVHYSKWHEAAGVEDTRDKLYEQFMKKTEGKVDGKLLRRILNANSELIDWLISEHDLGKDFVLGKGFFNSMGLISTYQEDYNAKRIDTTIGPGGHGWWFCLKLLSILLENGGEVIYHAAAKEILTNEDGSVRGVIADDPGGEIEITCKACVVAAGAFTRNHEIMNKMQPLFYDDDGKEPVQIFTCSRCTGDGLTMCEKLGADIDYKNRRVNLFGPMRHPYPCVSLNASRSFGSVTVNSVGEFYQSPFGMTEVSTLTFEPGRYCWSILDDAMVEDSIKNAMNSTEKDVVNIDLNKFLVKWREVLEEEEIAGSIVSANSIEELARKLGFDPEKFATIIKEQNENACKMSMPPFGGDGPGGEDMPGDPGDSSKDSMFNGGGPQLSAPRIEKPPFYAFKLKLFHENAIGGMTIDENTSVLKSGKPIPGLYAAGDNTRGIMLPGTIGVAYIEGNITALTFAFNSGYISGFEAVKYAKKSR